VNSSIKPRRNIAVGGPVLDGNEALYVQECLRTNSISSVGRFVADFERKFAEFCSVRHAISTCNGTCALHLALIALGLKPGDEVIVPTLTYVATANVVRYCGGRPVLVDVDRTTFNIDPAAIEAKVGPRTRASSQSTYTAIPPRWIRFAGSPSAISFSLSRMPPRHMARNIAARASAGWEDARPFPFTAIRS